MARQRRRDAAARGCFLLDSACSRHACAVRERRHQHPYASLLPQACRITLRASRYIRRAHRAMRRVLCAMRHRRRRLAAACKHRFLVLYSCCAATFFCITRDGDRLFIVLLAFCHRRAKCVCFHSCISTSPLCRFTCSHFSAYVMQVLFSASRHRSRYLPRHLPNGQIVA